MPKTDTVALKKAPKLALSMISLLSSDMDCSILVFQLWHCYGYTRARVFVLVLCVFFSLYTQTRRML